MKELPDQGLALDLVDQLGRVVSHWRVEQLQTVLDLSELRAGIYFLVGQQNGCVLREKLMLRR